MKTVLTIIGRAIAVYLTLSLVPGLVNTGGWITIFVLALVWAVITLIIRPVLRILTLPITIVTLGLFSLVLNTFLFWTMSLFVPSFHITGVIPAVIGAIVLSIFTSLITMVL